MATLRSNLNRQRRRMVVPRSYNPPASNSNSTLCNALFCTLLSCAWNKALLKYHPQQRRDIGEHSLLEPSNPFIQRCIYQQYSRPRHKTSILGFVENSWGSSQETLAGFKHSVIFGSFTICGHLQRPRAREEWHPTDWRQWTASQCDQMSVVQLLDMQSFGKK